MSDEEFFNNEDSYRFFQLVHMFQRTVMMNLGLMEYEGERFYDLNEAKEGIELLRMLQKKLKVTWMIKKLRYCLE